MFEISPMFILKSQSYACFHREKKRSVSLLHVNDINVITYALKIVHAL